MRGPIKTTVLLLVLCSVSTFGQKPRPRPTPIQKVKEQAPLTPRQIVDKVLPSVVLIVAQDENGGAISQGSGFVFKPGLVATNLHVFKRASNAFVKLVTGGINYKVTEVVGFDIRHDLCVVRIDDSSIPPLTLNGSNKPSIGDEVFALGNPRGLEGSVSKGIISSIRNDLGLIQMDAAISPGSSGGPVVNDRAEVIGIVVSTLLGGQNLNFAVKSEHLESLKLSYKEKVVVAGAISLKDREKDKLKGSVQRVTQSIVGLEYNEATERYTEWPAEIDVKWVYDIDGNRTDFLIYSQGKPLDRTQDFYNENGFITRRITGYVGYRQSEKLFLLGGAISLKVLEKKFSETVSRPTGYSSVYDRDGNEIESTYKYPGSPVRQLEHSYDRNGFETEEKEFANDRLIGITRNTYETDDHGNWIKQFTTLYLLKDQSSGYKPLMITYREIVYFG